MAEIYTTVVKVEFEDKKDPGHYRPGGYTYIADIPVKIGDIVVAPTKYGNNRARVCQLSVPPEQYERYKDMLRHITKVAGAGKSYSPKRPQRVSQMSLSGASKRQPPKDPEYTDINKLPLPF